jgi:tape measure domain-containing protein
MATSNKVEIDVTADTSQAVTALGDVKQELSNAGKAGGTSAEQIKAAWGVLGTRSFSEVKAEVNKVNAALDAVKANSKNPLEIKAATEAARAKIQSLEDGLKSAKSSAGGLGAAFGQIGPLIAASFTGRELIQTITQADSLKRGLVAIAGSTKAAESELAFIKKTSNELGLELNSTGQAYLQLTAATKGTAIEGQKTRDIFTSVSRAMSALGKSTAETENALRAVSQIASKGTVSMEELRGQLGEALPGALKAAADGMGVTTQELIKMVESGGVLAKDLLPKLAESLDKIYANGGPPDSLIAQFNRFKNKVSEVGIELGESGLTKALGDVAVVGAQAVGVLGKGFVGVGKGIGEVAGAVATLNFKPLIEDVKSAFNDTAKSATGVGDASVEAGNVSKQAFRQLEIAARNADDGLSRAAKNSLNEFEKFKAGGDTAAEAVAKIGKGFDLSTEPGIKDAAAVLAKLSNDGRISAEQFQKAWADNLKGVNLADFEAKARKAFSGPQEDLKALQQAIDSGLREAIKRTGLDFAVISGGMGTAARSAINDTEAIVKGLDSLKQQGVDTGRVLNVSIGKSINTADSAKAIEVVKQQIESLRKTLGDKVADGLLQQATDKAKELALALDGVKPGINSVAEAMKTLGITSDESLRKTAATAHEAYDTLFQSGKASARELQDAFSKYADTAIKANGGVASEALKSEAAMRGLSVQSGSTGDSISKAMNGAQGSVKSLGDQVQLTTEQLKQQAAEIDAINSKYGQGEADRKNKYAALKKGSTLTKDDLRAVDNGGLFSLQQKRASGTLSGDDLKTAEAAFNAASVNKEVFDKNSTAFSTEGARSILESYNSARLLLEEIRGLAGKSNLAGAKTPSANTNSASRTVNIQLKAPDGSTQTVQTDEAGAQALMKTLRSASLSA